MAGDAGLVNDQLTAADRNLATGLNSGGDLTKWARLRS
jgi:hypothetical protein